MSTFPLIRFEIEGMRHSLRIALMEHQVKMDSDMRAAIDAYCTPENIARIIRESAWRILDVVIKEEVDRFFRYGDGRKAVAIAVREAILRRETYTPLDNVDVSDTEKV